MPRRCTASLTFPESCSNANSGVWTPTITSPFGWYVAHHAFRCGSVRRQLMQEYVQKSIRTTLPRSAASVWGLELIHCWTPRNSGAGP